MTCDCLLGIFNCTEMLNLSDYVDILEDSSKFNDIVVHDYLDGRKGYTTKFYYCPYCGRK